jgi:hypothetical protein
MRLRTAVLGFILLIALVQAIEHVQAQSYRTGRQVELQRQLLNAGEHECSTYRRCSQR